MTLSVPRVRHHLKNFELEKLFIEELGWDRYSSVFDVPIDGNSFTLRAVAQKRGAQIFECRSDAAGKIPDHNLRRKIERQITKCAYEHLIIFTDAARTTQIWQWVARAPGQPTSYREHSYHPQHQSGDALIQKLSAIMIPLDEEEAIDLTGTVHKLRDAFDRDRVTKKFYDHFKREHANFLEFIQGVSDQADKEWYASLMLNRMMFIYFIQKKGFLDVDTSYLRNRLRAVQERKGKGKFLTFYRYFLLVLFHEGFSKQPQQRHLDGDLKELLGDVPYLNGGLFEVHELEGKHQKLDIPDEAFENLFSFFDQYEWTLDTRPLRNDREINPDVLGYIFEKYINQKEMGAYYTKEDITEYISKSTIIPYLFDAAKKKCDVAFESGSAVWRLLEEDPDRYIYPAVRKGVIDEGGEVIPLPEEIEKGINSVSQRDGWNRPADSGYALPTETWREHVSRRQRCLEIREKLHNSEIHEINDFITYNLNIRQFAEDVVAGSEGPELLRAFYEAISTVTVLDPTCGSGAFLFAALNILEPLYNACLDRMHAFIEDLDRSGERHSPRKFEDFRKTLADVDRHPNKPYFILKSIIVNNLYGVDIMEEAVEICKLRLFLKLVAQVDKTKDLEPLPDVDFNIRAGNTLVGFVSREEIRNAAEKETSGQGKLVFGQTEKALQRIEEEAEIVDRAYQKFHEMQTEYGMDAREFSDQKRELRQKLNKLKNELDCYLARDYCVDLNNSKDFNKWRINYYPFHWFAEFYGILRKGGFDAIIGNPPYVSYSKIRDKYQIFDTEYETFGCGNLYAYICERSIRIIQHEGGLGFILPLSSTNANDNWSFQRMIRQIPCVHISHFAVRPSKLFVGVDMNLTILLASFSRSAWAGSSTSSFKRWQSAYRPSLFQNITYGKHDVSVKKAAFPKFGSKLEISIWQKLQASEKRIASFTNGPKVKLAFHAFGRYWRKCIKEKLSDNYQEFEVSKEYEPFAVCILNSQLSYWYWIVSSDCYRFTKTDALNMPIHNKADNAIYANLAKSLLASYAENAILQKKLARNGKLVTEKQFFPQKSKTIIDEIDRIFSKHYGFTDEELDFIINYDIKYRMGAGDTEGDDEA